MDLASVGGVVGIIGGIIGAIGGIYILLEKLWLDKPKLYFEVHRNQINNSAGHSRTEVILSVSNIGGGKLGIGLVYLQSLEKDFIITSRSFDNMPGKDSMELKSFSLGKNECQEIKLYYKGAYIQDWEKRQKIKVKVVIRDLKRKTIGEKELDIPIIQIGG